MGALEVPRRPVGLGDVDAVQAFAGSDRDRLLDQLDRPGGLALLLGDDPQQVQGVRVAGLRLQNARVQCSGLVEATGLVVRQRFAEGVVGTSILVRRRHRCYFSAISSRLE